MNLYSIKSTNSPSDYYIAKFDEDFNLESSYIVSREECTCPQGHRPTCRHRKMLPQFLVTKRVNTDWFLDYDSGEWFSNHFGDLEQRADDLEPPVVSAPQEPVAATDKPAPAQFVRRI